jgi:hypothetical protein
LRGRPPQCYYSWVAAGSGLLFLCGRLDIAVL